MDECQSSHIRKLHDKAYNHQMRQNDIYDPFSICTLFSGTESKS